MKTFTTRLAIAFATASLAATALGAVSTGEANAASSDSHPDFAWWPARATSNKLFVGGLSYDTSSSHVQFNPKEITVEQDVPWQR